MKTRHTPATPKKNPRIVVFVQSRMGSSRLPGKILKKVLGKELLLLQVERIRKAKLADEVVVITTTKKQDEVIVKLCAKNHIACYRGSETDLLDRHYQAAEKFKADFVLKIGSDCPLADPKIIDLVLSFWKKNQDKYDFVSNYHPASFPDGMDMEGSAFATLETAWREAKKPHEREHTFPFVWDQPERFRIGNVLNKGGDFFTTHRWTIDYPEDFVFIKEIFEHFKDNPDFGMKEIFELLATRPELAKINSKYAGVNWYRNAPNQIKTIPRHRYHTTAPLKLTASLAHLKRAKKVIPGATQTLSKGYTQWSVGAVPLFLKSAKGCEVTDIDGNVYIDYASGLGPFILGYNDPDVTAAVEKQLHLGTMFTLPHPVEVEAAEEIIKYVPSAEMVRFGKNGSDATTGAIKLARAFTGKQKVITCGYHGWHDWYIATTERDAGILPILKNYSFPMQYNNIETLKKLVSEHKGEIAAVIMEPVFVIEPSKGYLEEVREITKKEGIVLIFDEVYTAFRWSMGGAQGFFKVTPDLTCLGKAMTNGFALSAIAGRRDIMELFDKVFFSFIYASEALPLTAVVPTLRKLKRENVHKYIWEIGTMLKSGVRELIKKHTAEEFLEIIGYAPKTAFNFKGNASATGLEMKTFFQQECAARGILFIGYHLPSFSHTKEHITYTLRAYDEIIGLLKEAMLKGNLKKLLRGATITQIFKNVGDRSSGMEKK